MKIYINGRFLTQRITGVQRYGLEMVKALDAGLSPDESHSFEILAPTRPALLHEPSLSRMKVRRAGRLQSHLWEQLELPLHTGGSPLISLCNSGPLAVSRQAVVIHDCSVYAFPGDYTAAFRLWYRFMLPRLGRGRRTVITVSAFSAAELRKHCHITASHIINPGMEHVVFGDGESASQIPPGLEQKPFILAAGTMRQGKNLQVLFRAMELLQSKEIQCVVAGIDDPNVYRSQHPEIPGQVKLYGYLSDSALIALYRHALCLVYPSLYEGFGLPPLEAMRCRCPVIAASIPAVREACGDAALYFNPLDHRELAQRLEELLATLSLRIDLIEKGAGQAAQYSWKHSAAGLLEVVKQAFPPE